MTEGQEIRASHQEVEAFVGELRGFYGGLKPVEQHMLATILGRSSRARRPARQPATAFGGAGTASPRREAPRRRRPRAETTSSAG